MLLQSGFFSALPGSPSSRSSPPRRAPSRARRFRLGGSQRAPRMSRWQRASSADTCLSLVTAAAAERATCRTARVLPEARPTLHHVTPAVGVLPHLGRSVTASVAVGTVVSAEPALRRVFLRAPVSSATRLATKVEVARPPGLEPGTPGLEIPCSIRLSYGRSRKFFSHPSGGLALGSTRKTVTARRESVTA